MDLAQSGAPIELLVEVAASLTPVVQDNDVNTTNGVYEVNLATFDVGTSAISNLVDVSPKLSKIPDQISSLNSAKANIVDYSHLTDTFDYASNTAPANYSIQHDGFLAFSCISTGAVNCTLRINGKLIYTNFPFIRDGGSIVMTHATTIPVKKNDVFSIVVNSGTVSEFRLKEIY
jgi:hypothetical protein